MNILSTSYSSRASRRASPYVELIWAIRMLSRITTTAVMYTSITSTGRSLVHKSPIFTNKLAGIRLIGL